MYSECTLKKSLTYREAGIREYCRIWLVCLKHSIFVPPEAFIGVFDLLFSPSTSVRPCRAAQSEERTIETSFSAPLRLTSWLMASGRCSASHSIPAEVTLAQVRNSKIPPSSLTLSLYWVYAIYTCCVKALQRKYLLYLEVNSALSGWSP